MIGNEPQWGAAEARRGTNLALSRLPGTAVPGWVGMKGTDRRMDPGEGR